MLEPDTSYQYALLSSPFFVNDMMKHLRYWMGVDHCAGIRRYGLVSHLRYIFNYDMDGVVVNLQRSLDDLPLLEVPVGLSFRLADLSKDKDRREWIRLVNAAYPDGREDDTSAKQHSTAHAFLDKVEVFFLCREEKPIATISTGVFRNDPTFGGNARIAVGTDEQGKGIGRTLILFALHHLRRKGLTHAETVITLKRERSLRLHFKLGFRIQPDRSQWKFDVQKRMWPVRRIVSARLRRLQQATLSIGS